MTALTLSSDLLLLLRREDSLASIKRNFGLFAEKSSTKERTTNNISDSRVLENSYKPTKLNEKRCAGAALN